jgi:hypothetical protein
VAKESFVSLAEEQLAKEADNISISKISIMTGVHRKDVARFSTKASSSNYEKKHSIDLPSRIIGQWQNNKRYCTPSGKPRSLRIDERTDEFAELVASVSKELKPQTLLFELQRMDVLKRTRHGVKLIQKAYIPKGNTEEGLYYLETDSHDLISAVENNIFSSMEPSHLHLKTEYTRIPASKVTEIKSRLLEMGSAFHQQVRNYLSSYDQDFTGNTEGDTQRIAVGTFSFNEITKETLCGKAN